ncbi:endo-1,4-beta-xylanase [Spirosoma linguale]|uniref:endo-1,4-beta-xylanase n=1 Tax=Spirosoma linguale TaxID=108 RepID=UPI003CC7C6AD
MLSLLIYSFLAACSSQYNTILPNQENTIEATFATRLASIAIDSNATLKSVSSFPVGAAPGRWLQTKSPKGFKLLNEQFNSETVHAYMNIQTSPGNYNFTEPDYWVEYAKTHSVRLHGHCLVYHQAAPNWLLTYKGTTADFEKNIKTHIQTVVGRYRGKIKSWDVINEVFSYSTGAIMSTPFRKLYASDEAYLMFVKRCFQWAHEADPDALLFYNDSNYEIGDAKVNAVLQLVADFKRSGIPIHGLGTQTHISIRTATSGIYSSLQKLATSGLLIHVSELDIRLNPDNSSNFTVTNQLLDAQRIMAQTVVQYYKRLIPVSQQYGITMWDLDDGNSWIIYQEKQKDAPCLFDADYNKKPAFYGFLEELK